MRIGCDAANGTGEGPRAVLITTSQGRPLLEKDFLYSMPISHLAAMAGFEMHFRQAARLLLLVLALLCCGRPACSQPNPDDDALRERVLQAIANAQKALMGMQKRDGTWPNNAYPSNDVGLTSLATLALLNSGVPADNDSVRRAVGWLKRPENDPDHTYDLALAIMALAASGDPAVNGKISRMAQRLEQYQNRGDGSGAWGYRGEEHWDNSNTQYAILGLREAAYAGVPVDREVWRRAQEHFLSTQQGPINNPTGAPWRYTPGYEPTGSMTVAGIASLTITSSMLDDDNDVTADGQIDCCRNLDDPVDASIESGVRWLSSHFRVRSNPGNENWPLYYLYGLERAGRFTGQRFFGDHDWYREGAEFLVSSQSVREGVWKSRTEDQVAGTSLALLFLAKGLSPVVINKLKFGTRNPETREVIGRDWNQHSRDISNLVDYTSGLPGWPKLLTWQIVDLRTAADGEGVAALLQSPIQFMSGTDRPDTIEGRELDLLRDYLVQGGFLFAMQNCGSEQFDAGFRDLIRRLFDGQYELRKLPPTHDVYRSENLFPPDTEVPELWGVDFGCRTAIIYAPYDHACRWQKWMKRDPPNRAIAVKTQVDRSMKLGVNVIAYATGRELQDKLQRPKILTPAELNRLGRGQLTIGRLRHTGGWDTAPNALRRLQSALDAVNIEVASETPTLAATDAALFSFPLLYMHGRKNFQFSAEERAKLKEYLENGGFLFADACCGSTQFDESFRKMIEETLGQKLQRIPIDDELYKLELGYDIRKVKRRVPSNAPGLSSIAAEETVGEPVLEGIKLGNKYVVVYSKYDISCALERQSTSACAGYPTEDAVRIAVNLVLYGLLQ
ncbi:DUF4159 domain-containing protein [Planctomicrobium piriforme]|uniref:DUF4159 domain-containing protein n=1 Tax=Planctomicrobium piriforme TaxID=1576369 RepID=A0A1I3EQK6_9PLAN|nr:DUF4159 domain-containing protein [Planctomicrobium piriforme]SFI01153.1 protein of unknown function [Planctomicrobium piriforme]